MNPETSGLYAKNHNSWPLLKYKAKQNDWLHDVSLTSSSTHSGSFFDNLGHLTSAFCAPMALFFSSHSSNCRLRNESHPSLVKVEPHWWLYTLVILRGPWRRIKSFHLQFWCSYYIGGWGLCCWLSGFACWGLLPRFQSPAANWRYFSPLQGHFYRKVSSWSLVLWERKGIHSAVPSLSNKEKPHFTLKPQKFALGFVGGSVF